jgi:hypothetical protein
MQNSVLPADQVTQVACLLGRAVLRWQRDRDANPRSLEIVSDSLRFARSLGRSGLHRRRR